jgi:hypothetical protein
MGRVARGDIVALWPLIVLAIRVFGRGDFKHASAAAVPDTIPSTNLLACVIPQRHAVLPGQPVAGWHLRVRTAEFLPALPYGTVRNQG